MRRHTTAWLIAVAVLGMALFVGCGKSKESEGPQAQMPGVYGQQPGAYGQQPGAYGQQPDAYGQQPGAYGQQPGAYGQQQMQAAEPEEVEPAGPPYRELYEQGELTDEELREEHELQQVERELGYPVGPE